MSDIRPAFLVVWVVLAQTSLADDSFRCGEKLVSLGDTEALVQTRCGPPDATRDLVDPNAPPHPLEGRSAPYRPNIIWIYRGLPGQFDKLLSFEDGTLVRIEEQLPPQPL